MGLNLNKREEDRPRLGRGRVPKEIKRRIDGERPEPASEASLRGRAWTRRVRKTKGDEGVQSILRERLRTVGGEWEDPNSWQPANNAQHRRLSEYREQIQREERQRVMLFRATDAFRDLERLVYDLQHNIQPSGEVYHKQPGASLTAPPGQAPLGCEIDKGVLYVVLGLARVRADEETLGDTRKREEIARYLVVNR